ncbi:MAG: hypothetical protein J5518_00020 [Lachnospiraceae bacterium]|nr:hypothetical protein [Lachnospiraceae bacterium]
MDYNRYNNNRDYGRNAGSKRKVQSVQDMMGPSGSSMNNHSSRNRSRNRTGSYEPSEFTGGIDSIAGVAFVVLLGVCVLASILYYIAGAGARGGYYPLNIVTINGVINDSYAGLPGAPAVETPIADSLPAPGTPEASALAGANSQTTLPATTADEAATPATTSNGAAMLLDAGAGVDGYTEAGSYAELLTQLDTAMAAGDMNFIGSKIGYTDDSTGSTLGFPQSVVEHFASFMAANPDKRQAFLDSIQDAEKYAGMSGTAHIVNLPLIRYKVTTDYDDTTFSFSGFSEQTINANQEATVAPMLPGMYTVTATCPAWAQPIEGQLEATFGENLEVNFGTN